MYLTVCGCKINYDIFVPNYPHLLDAHGIVTSGRWEIKLHNAAQQDNNLGIFDCGIYAAMPILPIAMDESPLIEWGPGATHARAWLRSILRGRKKRV